MTCASPFSVSLLECRDYWTKKCAADPLDGASGECIAFVRQEIQNGRSSMDDAVKAFCATSNDPRCDCVGLPQSVTNGKQDLLESHGPISCWYKSCTRDKLLTSELWNDSVTYTCPKPICQLSKSDFDEDGTHAVCPENFPRQMFSPLDLTKLKAHTAFLTRPLR